MRSDFEEDLESLVRQFGDGGRKARRFPVLGSGGDPRRVLQAEAAGDIRRRDFTDAIADDPARDDSPRLPERRQGDLEGELDGSIHLGLTDPRRRPVGHQLGRRRPAEVTTQDGVAPLDRGAEGGLAPEQGTAGALPEAAQTREDEDQSGTAPREPSPLRRCSGAARRAGRNPGPRRSRPGSRRRAPAGGRGARAVRRPCRPGRGCPQSQALSARRSRNELARA